MDIATAKAEATTRTWLPHTHTHTNPSPHTHLPLPLTWQHDIKQLTHREHVDGSTVRQVLGT